ncbi:MAG: hypothetical protein JSS32_08565 [Verrucomicrobia bacterium]|nr:hypothetical protein [Verrucomicrobiota bacterium]
MTSVSAARNCSFHHCVVKPIRNTYDALVQKIKQVLIRYFGFLLRVLIFQMGMIDEPGAQCVVDTFDRVTSNPKKGRIDRVRLAESITYFKKMWGEEIETTLVPADNKAKLDAIHLKRETFWQNVETMGGKGHRVPIEERREIILGKNLEQFGYPIEQVLIGGQERPAAVLYPDHSIKGDLAKQVRAAGCKKSHMNVPTERDVITGPDELLSLLKEKFFLPMREMSVEGVKQKVILLPEAHTLGAHRRPIMVNFHSPGRTLEMERRIAGILAPGFDILLFNPRGSYCEGTPSEAGYYLDSKKVVQHLLDQGYAPNDIFLLGYCGGAARAAAAVQEYNAQGVNFLIENPFHSLEAALEKFPWPLNKLGIMSLHMIKALDPETSSLVEEDGFNMVKKLERLDYSPTGGQIIVMHPKVDRMMPKDSVPLILQAASKTQRCSEIIRMPAHSKENSHMKRPTEDHNVWRELMKRISSGA